MRPWKLATLAIGLFLLIFGAYYYQLPDWDVPISIIMGLCAYIWAPWCVGILIYIHKHRPKNWYIHFIKCLAVSYFCISLTWELYNIPRIGIEATYAIYLGNLKASGLLFFITGILWQFEGSLKDLYQEVSMRKVKNLLVAVFLGVTMILQ